MQNQDSQQWSWNQGGSQSYSASQAFQSAYSTAPADHQNHLMSGYQQMYGGAAQATSEYSASDWNAAQLQHWQQWQQWQEKYQQWQAQYGKKYAETMAALGQNPNIILPGVSSIPGVIKPGEGIPNPGYTSVNPPPPPSNAQPVPPPPPEEEKPAAGENPEELSEAEKTFDVQFKQWEDQFNDWKKQNQDHPDKVQYREYEKKWENWREQLLQRREQMRKKRLNKCAEAAEGRGLGKMDDSNAKGEQDRNLNQGNNEIGNNNPMGDNQPGMDMKMMSVYGRDDNQGMFLQQRARDDTLSLNPAFPDMNYPLNLPDNRMQGYYDRDNMNFVNQQFGPDMYDRNSLRYGMEGNRDRYGMASRMENRGEFFHRRPYGNGNFEDDRNFGLRVGNFDGRKPGQDRFHDGGHKDMKYNSGRDCSPNNQLNDHQAFMQVPRSHQDRNFGGEMKSPFSQSPGKTNVGSSFKSRVPSLFDITVERPPGLKSPGKDRKQKIWDQESFDGADKDEKNAQRSDAPWMSNASWANNSPWIKPWELDRVSAEKPADSNLRSDVWQRESMMGMRGEDKAWKAEMNKSDVDSPEYSGCGGKMFGKYGNFNALPQNAKDKNAPGFSGEYPGQMDENKLKAIIQSQNWPGMGDSNIPNPSLFIQDGQSYVQNFGRVEGPQIDVDNRMEDLFGRGDCDERIRFEQPNFTRDARRDGRFIDPFRRDNRGFPEERRMPGSKAEDDRFFGKGDRNSFDRIGAKFPALEDVDERKLRGRDRRGRGFEDRDDRPFRGHVFDRDERRNRGTYDRFGRSAGSGAKDMEWNPQVFDYSKGNKQNFRSHFNEPKENFRISKVVDYSHGENKQTFDYGHGEGKNDKIQVKSFDYGHGSDSPAVIDYGHGSEKDASESQEWNESQDRGDNRDRSRSKSKSPQKSRSPKSKPRSRSRSPISGGKTRGESTSPSSRGNGSRSKDRSGRQNVKRNKRNNSQEKPVANKDEDVSKNNFDVTTVLVEDLICSPGRESRPNKLVFIIRGLPGSGKTYVTKLIKDKEIELGGDAPRILSLDDYFMTEVEKEVTDEETGRKIKKKVLEYEYESCAEPHYRGSLLKAFKKTVSDGFFSFIIVDSVNEKTKDYEEMWSFAKQKGFQVYVAEMDDDVIICTKRNIHKRTEKEISELSASWEKTPGHYLRLDVRSLLQADAITEVEMEVVSDPDLEKVAAGSVKEKGVEKAEEEKEKDKEKEEEEEEVEEAEAATATATATTTTTTTTTATEEGKEEEEEVSLQDEPGESAFVKSRWDHFENSEQKLDRLDGLKKRREGFHATMQDYLQLPDDFDVGSNEPADGKKKVRWADLEERRQQEKMRAIGFVVGQTDWSRMTDPTFGESALTRTKYI